MNAKALAAAIKKLEAIKASTNNDWLQDFCDRKIAEAKALLIGASA